MQAIKNLFRRSPHCSIKAASPTLQQQLNQDAWRKMVALGVAGLGVGAGARSLIGLRELFKRPVQVDPLSSVPTSIPVYVPPPADEDDEQPLRATGRMLKRAIFGDARPGINWWQIPVGLTAAAGGAAGGWSLVDKMMRSRKNYVEAKELEDAQREYAAAIRGAMEMKGKLAAALDAAYVACEDAEFRKTAGDGIAQTVGDALHLTGGGLAALAAATAAATGIGTFSWMRHNSKQKILDAAIKRRRQMRTQPLPFYAYPVPLPPRDEAA